MPAKLEGKQGSDNALAAELPLALLVTYAQFAVQSDGPDGANKVATQPGAARFEIIRRRAGAWQVEAIEDAASNVFHKALWSAPAGQRPGIVTLGGSAAIVKRWRRNADGKLAGTVLWQASFGGRFDRMRDAEIADVYGDGQPSIVVGTHDQGVVAVLRPRGDAYQTVELGRQANTFIHEIEVGDLNGDSVREVYATPSEPNKLSGGEQQGSVVRYVPKLGQGPTVVADLGKRHAKEILVADVDGDGKDELYVAVEALTAGQDPHVTLVEPVEIRRYDAATPATQGRVVARIQDRLCRFLTAGDVDGDGKREMVAAAFRSGLWLLRPGKTPQDPWATTLIDGDSAGFEHASLLADLDGDKKDELYVAADEQGELRRYLWVNGKPQRTTLLKRDVPRSRLTWNITTMPAMP